MSLKNTKTTTSGLNWNEMLGLLQRLKKDKRYFEYLLVGTGCFLGLRAKDLLNLRCNDVLFSACKKTPITTLRSPSNWSSRSLGTPIFRASQALHLKFFYQAQQ